MPSKKQPKERQLSPFEHALLSALKENSKRIKDLQDEVKQLKGMVQVLNYKPYESVKPDWPNYPYNPWTVSSGTLYGPGSFKNNEIICTYSGTKNTDDSVLAASDLCYGIHPRSYHLAEEEAKKNAKE